MRKKKISRVGRRNKTSGISVKMNMDFSKIPNLDEVFSHPKDEPKKRGRPRKEEEKKIVVHEDDFSSIEDAEEIENIENSEVSE